MPSLITLLLLAALTSALPSPRLQNNFTKLVRGLQACYNINKSPKGADQVNVCEYTVQDLHFICTPTSYQAAWQVCAALGYRLAVIDSLSQEAFNAFDITDGCILNREIGAWVAAYNGMDGLPCMYMQPDGTIIQSNGENCDKLMPVICQDIPQVTVTEPEFNEGVLSITVTSTVALCPTSPCSCARNCRQRECGRCEGGRLFTDALGNVDRWPRCCDNQGCDPLCPTALNDLYIINAGVDGVPFNQADRECQKYGLHLADLTTALLPSFANLTDVCAADAVKFWIRSFNGVGGTEQCVWAQGGQQAQGGPLSFYPVGYGVIPSSCFDLSVQRILCQDRPAAQLGLGPFKGTVTGITTVTIGDRYFSTEIISTDVTTVTFYP